MMVLDPARISLCPKPNAFSKENAMNKQNMASAKSTMISLEENQNQSHNET